MREEDQPCVRHANDVTCVRKNDLEKLVHVDAAGISKTEQRMIRENRVIAHHR